MMEGLWATVILSLMTKCSIKPGVDFLKVEHMVQSAAPKIEKLLGLLKFDVGKQARVAQLVARSLITKQKLYLKLVVNKPPEKDFQFRN